MSFQFFMKIHSTVFRGAAPLNRPGRDDIIQEAMSTDIEPIEPSPLTRLSEEEEGFRAEVRRFAREQIGPHVRDMDEKGVFRKEIIQQFFELGLMSIEIPEELGGQGGTFFQAVLAVEDSAVQSPQYLANRAC